MNFFNDLPDVLTVAELARFLNVSPKSVYQLLQNGEIKHRKIGRIYRISKQAIKDYLS